MRTTSALIVTVLLLTACGGADGPEVPASHEIWFVDLDSSTIGVVDSDGERNGAVAAPTEFRRLAAIDGGTAVAGVLEESGDVPVVVISDAGLQSTGLRGRIGCLSAAAGSLAAHAVELDEDLTAAPRAEVAAAGGWRGTAWSITRDGTTAAATPIEFEDEHYFCAVFGGASTTRAYATISLEHDWSPLTVIVDDVAHDIELPGCNLVPQQFASGDASLLFSAACIDGEGDGLYLAEFDDGEPAWRSIRNGATAAATWGPGGRLVAFAAIVEDESRVLLLDIETGDERVLTDGSASWPVWVTAGLAEAAREA